jgi:hypothetical protein
VKDSAGNEKWRLTAKAPIPPFRYVFEGKDASGYDLKEGGYQALLPRALCQRYEPKRSRPHSCSTSLRPRRGERKTSAAFSPNGDGKQDTVPSARDFS